jgi:uroporphyrinogen-III synthase
MTANPGRGAMEGEHGGSPRLEDQSLRLQGLRVLVTRPEGQAEDFVERLRDLGAEPVVCATIRIVPPADWAPLDQALRQLADYDWVIFTSVNGVRSVCERLADLNLPITRLACARLAAIGPATRQALAEQDLAVALMPHKYVAEAILDEIGHVAGQRILLPRADIARKALADGLRSMDAQVDEVTAYCTVAATSGQTSGQEIPGQETLGLASASALMRVPALPAGPLDVATFTSPSTVRNFLALLETAGRPAASYLAGAQVACIGPITAQAAREAGLPVHIEATEHTVDGLIQALIAYGEQRK